MPRVNLSFTLPDEESEYTVARRGGEYLSALTDITQYLRDQVKYVKKPHTIDQVYENVWEILRAHKIDPWGE